MAMLSALLYKFIVWVGEVMISDAPQVFINGVCRLTKKSESPIAE